MANYKYKRWQLDGKLIFVKYGSDYDPSMATDDNSWSYGNDLYESTGTFEEPSGKVYEGRPSDFGIDMYQGNLTTVNLKNFNIAYIVNPKTNLKINLGVTLRDFKNEDGELKTQFINFAIKSDLFNHYYDF